MRLGASRRHTLGEPGTTFLAAGSHYVTLGLGAPERDLRSGFVPSGVPSRFGIARIRLCSAPEGCRSG